MDKQLTNFEMTLDTGDNTDVSIAPYLDGEYATQQVLRRPTEMLRQRTEILRGGVDDLRYLADADRVLHLSGGGKLTWDGVYAAGAHGFFTITSDLELRPFMAPAQSTPAKLNIGGIEIATRTAKYNGVNPLRAYGRLGDTTPGANRFSFEVVLVPGQVVPVLTLGPNGDPRHYKLTVAPTHTVQQAADYLAADGAPVTVEFRNRFTVTVTTGVPNGTYLAAFRDYFSGAVDAELHKISPATVDTFFTTAANRLLEGDVLCIRYDGLTLLSGGGRRQSIDDASVEANASVPAASLFVLRNHPEWLAFALPVALVRNGILVLANGAQYASGVPGASVQAGGDSRHYAAAKVGIGGGTTGDTVRAELAGNGGTGGKDGRVILYRDGAQPREVTYDALDTLLGGKDANALHTHPTILRRWMATDESLTGLVGETKTVTQFVLATAYDGQIVAVDFNLLVRLPAGIATTLRWEVWVDDAKAQEWVSDPIETSLDPDQPDIPLNGSVWKSIATAGTGHKFEVRISSSAAGWSLVRDSRVVIS